METYELDGWGVLGDRTRRTIFERVALRPQTVGELAAGLPVSRPAVSQHLRVLKNAGLVADQRSGNRRIYRVDPEGLAAFRAQLDGFWTRTLTAFRASAEQLDAGDGMTTQADPESTVRTEIVVRAPQERAFAVFTERFGDFKPAEHNIMATPIVRTVFEREVGGRLYDVGEDGTECRFGRVLAYDPPNRVVFSWDIGPAWQIETDPARTSEVEIRFVAETPERTRVEIEHRHLDRHGAGWLGISAAVRSEGGWPVYLSRYAALFADA